MPWKVYAGLASDMVINISRRRALLAGHQSQTMRLNTVLAIAALFSFATADERHDKPEPYVPDPWYKHSPGKLPQWYHRLWANFEDEDGRLIISDLDTYNWECFNAHNATHVAFHETKWRQETIERAVCLDAYAYHNCAGAHINEMDFLHIPLRGPSDRTGERIRLTDEVTNGAQAYRWIAGRCADQKKEQRITPPEEPNVSFATHTVS